MRKKTYVFDERTLDLLNVLKEELNQKEVSIIKEAIRLMYENHRKKQKMENSFEYIVEKLDYIVGKVESLSYELGQCRERTKILENKLKELYRKKQKKER